jgi:KUP system potassium uptake protein
MTTLSIPWVRNANRLTIKEIYPKVWRAVGSYGFMERTNVPRLVRQAMNSDATLVLDKVTYYIGHETILSGDRSRKGLPKLIRKIFAFMQRNAVHESDYFQLPNDSVVKIGRQVEL